MLAQLEERYAGQTRRSALGKHRGLPLRQNIALHAGECYEVYRVPSLPRAALFELGNHGGLPLLSLRTAEGGVAISIMAIM